MSKFSTAARLLREPSRFLDALISRMYWSRAFTTLVFRCCDWRDARALAGPDPIPPSSLRFIVYGTVDPERFRQSKSWSMQAIETSLGRAGKTLADFSAIFDFGCGCGRLLADVQRKAPGATLAGSDVDADAIAWDRKHLPGIDFRVNPPLPPSNFAAESFDLIYLISVFTHINEDAQRQWLTELRRLLRPGGTLLITVHGPNFWRTLPARHLAELERAGFLYLDPVPAQPNGSFHTAQYVRRVWSELFEVREYIPNDQLGIHQDMAVLTKPLS